MARISETVERLDEARRMKAVSIGSTSAFAQFWLMPRLARFGFDGSFARSLHLPGPVERARFLGLELVPGALDGAEGLVSASGVVQTRAVPKAA